MFRKILLGALVCASLPFPAIAVDRENLGICGGRATAFAWDDVSGLMYVGMESAYTLFKSADSGTSWQNAFPEDSLATGWSGGTRVVRANGGMVLSIVNNGQTVIGSSDGGESWRTVVTTNALRPTLEAMGIMGMVPNLTDLAIKDGVIRMAGGWLIYTSTDSAQTWEVTLFPDSTWKDTAQNSRMSISAITSDGMVLAAPTNSRATALYVPNDEGVYSPMQLIDPTKTAPNDTFRLFSQVVNCPGDSNLLVAVGGTYNSGSQQMASSQIFVSVDHGANWTTCADAAGKLQPGNLDISTVILCPGEGADGALRIITGLNYSDDTGATWTHVSNSNGPAIHGIWAYVPGADTWFAFNEDSPYRCVGLDGNVWTPSAAGITAVQVRETAQYPGNLDLVYLATGSGIAITKAFTGTFDDPAERWQGANGVFPMQPFGGIPSVSCIGVSPYDSSVVCAGGGNGLWIAENGGMLKADWRQVNYGNPGGQPTAITGLDVNAWSSGGGWMNSIVWFSPDTILGTFAAGGYGGVIISTDNGATWAVWDVLPTVACGVAYVAEDEATGTKGIFVGYGNRESSTNVPCMVWRSFDGGVTWDSCTVSGGSTNQGTHNMIYEISSGAGTLDTLFFATEFGIAVSSDSGATAATYVPTGPGMQFETRAVTVDKNDKHLVYFASREKIFLFDWTIAAAPTLQLYYSALAGEQINDIYYDALTMSSSTGFFGLSGEASTAIEKVAELPKALSTSIMKVASTRNAIDLRFSVPTNHQARVEIVNLSGRLVASRTFTTLVGDNVFHLDVSGLATGMYAARLIDPAGVQVQRFAHIR